MNWIKQLLVLIFCIFSLDSNAQDSTKKWSAVVAYEVNYTGTNALAMAQYEVNCHNIGVGAIYNFSDGFSNNPVIGMGLSYEYIVVSSEKWKAAVGLAYWRQKPLKIVNIQSLNYTTGVSYIINHRISVLSKVGYGVAAERAATAGEFTQSNNISGSFQLGCVFRL